MAFQDFQAPSAGIWNSIKGALNLFSGINKTEGVSENPAANPIDEFKSTLSDGDVLNLVDQWKNDYKKYYSDIEPTQKLAFEYWIGKQRDDDVEAMNGRGSSNLVDNLIFEAVETFLPIATRANPEPLVQADPGEMGQKLASDIRAFLVNEADTQVLRRKLARMTRHWTINRIGVLKVDFDEVTNNISTKVIHPKRIILDKDGYIDEKGIFHGEYIGEKKRASAAKLIQLFPSKKADIEMNCQGKLDTKLEYFEWWYKNTDLLYTMDRVVLGKFKNPHWNYDGVEKRKDPETQAEIEVEIQGTNHLPSIQAPYVFLCVFNTAIQPHDETSLILQNVGLQDMINRRWRQIDRNVEGMNNGMVVSGKSFTEEQASLAASALRRGIAIRVPDGKVSDAVQRFPANPIPSDVFNSLVDGRNELRNVFGTSGSTPQGVEDQKSVRGKILVNQLDSSRIGGGVTEYIEQVADSVYNLWTQMMFVHFNTEHYITTVGPMGGLELIALKNTNLVLLKTLRITVKEGSLIPKDPLTQRNEAIDLWSANAIDPKTLFRKLDYPDPDEAAKQLILWQMVQQGKLPPQFYIPDFPMQPPMMDGTNLQQQGVGDEDINNIGQTPPVPPPVEPSAESVGAESKQLLGAVPIG